MSLEHAPQRADTGPRKVIRLARLGDYLALKHSQLSEVVKQLVKAGLLTPPFNPSAGCGSAKVVWADEIARIQQIGVNKALAAAKEDSDDEAA